MNILLSLSLISLLVVIGTMNYRNCVKTAGKIIKDCQKLS